MIPDQVKLINSMSPGDGSLHKANDPGGKMTKQLKRESALVQKKNSSLSMSHFQGAEWSTLTAVMHYFPASALTIQFFIEKPVSDLFTVLLSK